MTPRTRADLPALDEFPATADPSTILPSLIRTGAVIIRSLIPVSALDTIDKDTRPYLEADQPYGGAFFAPQTRRVFGLAGKSPTFITSIVANQLFQSLATTLLTSEHKAWMGNHELVSKSPPQLNNTVVLSVLPGAHDQELHRDDMIHHNRRPAITADEYKVVGGNRDTSLGLFVAGTRTTRANGATRFIPGSHLWDYSEGPPSEELTVYAELERGDAFIMLPSCFHGGSANTTRDEERIVHNCFMTRGYLRQEENQYLANPFDKIREYPEEIQKLIGYQVSEPFLGYVDLDDPRKVLYGKDWTAKPHISY